MSDNINNLLKTEYSERFDDIRKKMVCTSFYKYGPAKTNCKQKLVDVITSLEKRLQAYKDTGNTEYLADIANFAMFEFMYPQHPKASYSPTDSNESPGIVGMSIKEIEDYDKVD